MQKRVSDPKLLNSSVYAYRFLFSQSVPTLTFQTFSDTQSHLHHTWQPVRLLKPKAKTRQSTQPSRITAVEVAAKWWCTHNYGHNVGTISMLISHNHDALVKPADWWLHPRQWGELARFDVKSHRSCLHRVPARETRISILGCNEYGMQCITTMKAIPFF